MTSLRPNLRLEVFLRVLATLALVGLITWLDRRVLEVNSATAALTFLLLILGLATRVGRLESIIASTVAVVCYNYFFLPPVGALTITDPQNWVALLVFLITALTVSHLSASAEQRAAEASARRLEMEQVYEFSRALLLGDQERSLASQIVQRASEILQAPEAACYEAATGRIWRVGGEELLPESSLAQVSRTANPLRDPQRGLVIEPLVLGGRAYGCLGLVGTRLSVLALQAVAQLAAIAMQRALEQENASRQEAARQNEQLKSTLLDALAHEFKTPLTSIKAAASTVVSRNVADPVDREMLLVVEEESDRLTNLVNEMMTVARIEAGQVELDRVPVGVRELIESTLAQLRPLADERAIAVFAAASLPPVLVDVGLTQLVLRQLLHNAFRYAPVSSPIRLRAALDGGEMVIEVENDGPGIVAAEQAAIFEKFYRGRDVRDRIPGTGLGLKIARDIVETQGGRIWLDSEPGRGVRFRFSLPLAPRASSAARE